MRPLWRPSPHTPAASEVIARRASAGLKPSWRSITSGGGTRAGIGTRPMVSPTVTWLVTISWISASAAQPEGQVLAIAEIPDGGDAAAQCGLPGPDHGPEHLG